MEGGGQILRTVATYSAILGVPVKIFNIRAKRSDPGLKPQHLTTMKAVAELSKAEVKGLYLESDTIEFKPKTVRGGTYLFDIGTAGSISLLLQCIIPVASFADRKVSLRIIGGTAVRTAPSMAFFDHLIWKALRLMGFEGTLKILKEGFYPKGGGVIEIAINPIRNIRGINRTSCKVEEVSGVSMCGRLPIHIADRQAFAAKETLRKNGLTSNISIVEPKTGEDTFSPGSYICLWAEGEALIGADSLGERGKKAETVGQEAAQRLIGQIKSGACVDLHTADNLILPASLAEGISKYTVSSLTRHTLTIVELAKKFTESKINVEGTENRFGTISIQGAGTLNSSLTR